LKYGAQHLRRAIDRAVFASWNAQFLNLE